MSYADSLVNFIFQVLLLSCSSFIFLYYCIWYVCAAIWHSKE